MEEYISSNDIPMVKGKNFDWQRYSVYFDKKDPFLLYINLGESFSSGTDFFYDMDKKILIIDGKAFDIPTIEQAEEIVLSFSRANNFEIPPLHKH